MSDIDMPETPATPANTTNQDVSVKCNSPSISEEFDQIEAKPPATDDKEGSAEMDEQDPKVKSYTKDEMLALRSSPASQILPVDLKEDFIKGGVWDPEEWHRSKSSRSSTPTIDEKMCEGKISHHVDDDGIELAPHRRSFRMGCSIAQNRDGDKLANHIPQRVQDGKIRVNEGKSRLTGRAANQRATIESSFRDRAGSGGEGDRINRFRSDKNSDEKEIPRARAGSGKKDAEPSRFSSLRSDKEGFPPRKGAELSEPYRGSEKGDRLMKRDDLRRGDRRTERMDREPLHRGDRETVRNGESARVDRRVESDRRPTTRQSDDVRRTGRNIEEEKRIVSQSESQRDPRDRRAQTNERAPRKETLPEWATDGPKSQNDAFEFKGMKEFEEERQAMKRKSKKAGSSPTPEYDVKSNGEKAVSDKKQPKGSAIEKDTKTTKAESNQPPKETQPPSETKQVSEEPSQDYAQRKERNSFDINDFFNGVDYLPSELFHEDQTYGDGVKSKFSQWFNPSDSRSRTNSGGGTSGSRPGSRSQTSPGLSPAGNAPAFFSPIQPAVPAAAINSVLGQEKALHLQQLATSQNREIRGRLTVGDLEPTTNHQQQAQINAMLQNADQQQANKNAFDMLVKTMKDAGQLPEKPAPVVTGLPDHLLPKAPRPTSPSFELLKRKLSRSPSPVQALKNASAVASFMSNNNMPANEMELALHQQNQLRQQQMLLLQQQQLHQQQQFQRQHPNQHHEVMNRHLGNRKDSVQAGPDKLFDGCSTPFNGQKPAGNDDIRSEENYSFINEDADPSASPGQNKSPAPLSQAFMPTSVLKQFHSADKQPRDKPDVPEDYPDLLVDPIRSSLKTEHRRDQESANKEGADAQQKTPLIENEVGNTSERSNVSHNSSRESLLGMGGRQQQPHHQQMPAQHGVIGSGMRQARGSHSDTSLHQKLNNLQISDVVSSSADPRLAPGYSNSREGMHSTNSQMLSHQKFQEVQEQMLEAQRKAQVQQKERQALLGQADLEDAQRLARASEAASRREDMTNGQALQRRLIEQHQEQMIRRQREQMHFQESQAAKNGVKPLLPDPPQMPFGYPQGDRAMPHRSHSEPGLDQNGFAGDKMQQNRGNPALPVPMNGVAPNFGGNRPPMPPGAGRNMQQQIPQQQQLMAQMQQQNPGQRFPAANNAQLQAQMQMLAAQQAIRAKMMNSNPQAAQQMVQTAILAQALARGQMQAQAAMLMNQPRAAGRNNNNIAQNIQQFVAEQMMRQPNNATQRAIPTPMVPPNKSDNLGANESSLSKWFGNDILQQQGAAPGPRDTNMKPPTGKVLSLDEIEGTT